MPKKPKWRRKLEKKLREFAGVCLTALVVFLMGFIFPMFFIIYAFSAFLILFFGTLGILGFTVDDS